MRTIAAEDEQAAKYAAYLGEWALPYCVAADDSQGWALIDAFTVNEGAPVACVDITAVSVITGQDEPLRLPCTRVADGPDGWITHTRLVLKPEGFGETVVRLLIVGDISIREVTE